MQRLLILALFLTTLFILKVSEAAVQEDRAYFPPVIMYHDIKLLPQNNFDVTLKDFRQQLKWLSSNGYKTLSIEEFVDIVKSGKTFPKNSVLITFDDGFSDAIAYSLPELKSHNMKATFFINPWYIGKKAKGYPYITEADLKNLATEPLISIASHTTRHFHLDKLSPEDLAAELNDSKATLEEITGKPVLALSYPFGEYNADVIAATQAAGYEIAFAVQDRGLFDQPARFSIPRIYMGLALCADNQALFKKYVRNYSKMPLEAFMNRWQPLSK